MGVLIDYFRAGDVAAVQRAMQHTDGGPLVGVPGAVFDGIAANGLDDLVLSGLLRCITGTEWRTNSIEAMVWPLAEPPGEEEPQDDNPWGTGPWVSQLPEQVRDTLADVDDGAIDAIAQDWADTEELRELGAGGQGMKSLLADLIALARSARAADEQLYSWVSL